MAPRVSATLLLDQRRVSEELVGNEVVERALGAIPEPHRGELLSLAAGGWCSVAAGQAFHRAMAEALGRPLADWQKIVVQRGIERTFSTVWRIFLRLTSTDAIVKRTAMVFAKTYDTGSLTARELGVGHLELALTGWADVPEYELRGIALGVEAVLKLAGRKNAAVLFTRQPGGARFDVLSSE